MKRVLIVDDSPMLIKVLEKILSQKFEVVGRAFNGIEGFESYRKLQPDIVLLDITMPHCNGIDCLRMIIQFDPEAVVYMCSSRLDDQTVQVCQQIGAKGFISKDEISLHNLEAQNQIFSQLHASKMGR